MNHSGKLLGIGDHRGLNGSEYAAPTTKKTHRLKYNESSPRPNVCRKSWARRNKGSPRKFWISKMRGRLYLDDQRSASSPLRPLWQGVATCRTGAGVGGARPASNQIAGVQFGACNSAARPLIS